MRMRRGQLTVTFEELAAFVGELHELPVEFDPKQIVVVQANNLRRTLTLVLTDFGVEVDDGQEGVDLTPRGEWRAFPPTLAPEPAPEPEEPITDPTHPDYDPWEDE